MAACVGAIRGPRVRSVTIIGSSGVGAPGSAVKLEKVRHLEGQERHDTHRVNLSRLMIADPAKIDELAILIQDWNTIRSRLRTPAISRSGAIMKAIDQLQSPLNGMWGEFDAPANPKGPERVATLRAHCPQADIRLIPEYRPLGGLRIRRHRQRDPAGNAGPHQALTNRPREETSNEPDFDRPRRDDRQRRPRHAGRTAGDRDRR